MFCAVAVDTQSNVAVALLFDIAASVLVEKDLATLQKGASANEVADDGTTASRPDLAAWCRAVVKALCAAGAALNFATAFAWAPLTRWAADALGGLSAASLAELAELALLIFECGGH